MTSDGALYLQLAQTIATAIRSGTLVAGERVPSVREMARQEGVSLSTVIQAYRSLEDAHLIEARPRSGYFVATRTPGLPQPETSRPPADSQAVDVGSLTSQVLRLANDPSFTSFGAACPSAELFSQDRVRRAVSRAAQRNRHSLCTYPIGGGEETLRRAIARHGLRMGCQLDARDIVITNGCVEAITLCLRAVTKPGDIVALESPTYFGFLSILENLHLRALEIPTHPRTGVSLDALQLAFDTQPVKAVLLVPTLSNPVGATMPQQDRARLAAMLSRHDVPLIEDVLYNDLAEDDDMRRAVKSYDTTGHVMMCGSYSKTVAPGIRLGWVEAGRWRDRVEGLKLATSGAQTAVLELAMADLLTQPGAEASYRQLRATVAARVDEAGRIIAESFPAGTRVTDPPGGFILWAELPREIDTFALFRACLAEHIVFAPGTMFSATDRYRHCVRLGVGGRWDNAQRQALRRIGEMACEMLQAKRPKAAGDRQAEPALAG